MKKLVSKVQQKDQFNYRHFTDRPEDEDPKPLEIKSSEEEEKIGKGFKAFFAVNYTTLHLIMVAFHFKIFLSTSRNSTTYNNTC